MLGPASMPTHPGVRGNRNVQSVVLDQTEESDFDRPMDGRATWRKLRPAWRPAPCVLSGVSWKLTPTRLCAVYAPHERNQAIRTTSVGTASSRGAPRRSAANPGATPRLSGLQRCESSVEVLHRSSSDATKMPARLGQPLELRPNQVDRLGGQTVQEFQEVWAFVQSSPDG